MKSRIGWKYDHRTESFKTPLGNIPLLDLIKTAADRATGKIDLTGRWSGWKIRNGALIGPGQNYRITPETLRLFGHWVRNAQAQTTPNPGQTAEKTIELFPQQSGPLDPATE